MRILKNKKNRSVGRKITNQKTTVYSYYKSKSNKQGSDADSSYRIKITAVLKKLFLFLITLIFLVAIIYSSIIVESNVKLEDIKNNTVAIRDIEDYKKTVNEFLTSSLLNRSKLTFDNEGLVSKLKNLFPEIQSVNINSSVFSDSLDVNIILTEPLFKLETSSKIAVVGDNGIILSVWDKSNYRSDNSLGRVVDSTGIEPEAGKPAFPKEQLLFMAIVNEQLEKKNFKVEYFTLATSPYDLHVKLKDKIYFVKFNVLEDPIRQTGILIAFIENEESREGVAVKEYIDVRVGEKLFYK